MNDGTETPSREGNVNHLYPRPSKSRRVMPVGTRIRVVTLLNELKDSGRLKDMSLADIHRLLETDLKQWVSYGSVRNMLAANPLWVYKKREVPAGYGSPWATARLEERVRSLEDRLAVLEKSLGVPGH